MKKEKVKHLFVGEIPILIREINFGKQCEIEIWLDLDTILRELNLTKITNIERNKKLEYIR